MHFYDTLVDRYLDGHAYWSDLPHLLVILDRSVAKWKIYKYKSLLQLPKTFYLLISGTVFIRYVLLLDRRIVCFMYIFKYYLDFFKYLFTLTIRLSETASHTLVYIPKHYKTHV